MADFFESSQLTQPSPKTSWLKKYFWPSVLVGLAILVFLVSYGVGRRFLLLRSGDMIAEKLPLTTETTEAPVPPVATPSLPAVEVLPPVTQVNPATPDEPAVSTVPAESPRALPEETKVIPAKKEVEQAAGAVGYRVQAGVFQNRANAEAVAQALREKSFEVLVKEAQEGVYLVQCGLFSEKKRAEDWVTKIREAGFEALWVAVNRETGDGGNE